MQSCVVVEDTNARDALAPDAIDDEVRERLVECKHLVWISVYFGTLWERCGEIIC